MRLRSQSPTTTSNPTPQVLSTGQSSVASSAVTNTVIQRAPRSKLQKRLPLLRTALLIGALTLTGIEASHYISQAIEQKRRAPYFVYTGYFPQAAAYSPSGKYLAVCTPHAKPLQANTFSLKGSKVELYEPETGKEIKSIYDGDLMFEDISFSKKEQILYAHSSSRNLTQVYNIATGESHRVIGGKGAIASRLNLYNNSVIRIYTDRISVQRLENPSLKLLALPKNLEKLDSTVTGLMFSKDSRFISWVIHSSDYEKKVLRLADMKTGHVFDLLTTKGSSIQAGREPLMPIIAAPDGKTIYLSGNVQESSSRYDFSHGIAQVDIESGKIIRSQHQPMGVRVSRIKDNGIFVENGNHEEAPLFRWDQPVDALVSTFGNVLAESPDNRWRLVYGRYGVKRQPIMP